MIKEIKISLIVLVLMTVLTGILYPLGITVAAKIFFPHQAAGSLIVQDGKVIGSELVGQNFDDPRYLWGRLSATSPVPYNAAASSGSNLGPMNPVLLDNAKARMDALVAAGSNASSAIPIDLVTASGSGLDPHISPASAEYQVERIAKAGLIPAEKVREIIRDHTTGRTFGFLGEPRVTVLTVNLALNQLYRIK